MEFFNQSCQSCHKPMNGGVYRAPHICPHCLHEHAGGKSRVSRKSSPSATTTAFAPEPMPIQTPQAAPAIAAESAAPTVVLTAKSADEHTLLEVIDRVDADCVLSIKLTPDLVSNGKFIGGKSEKVKAALVQGKKHALVQLRLKAQEQGANIVTDVAVKNAIKSVDAEKVTLVVSATGMAAVVELTQDATEEV